MPDPDPDPDPDPLNGDLFAPHVTPPAIDPTVATPARIYSYLLGGKDHFPADRAAAEKALEGMPVRDFARVNRAFLTRAATPTLPTCGLGSSSSLTLGSASGGPLAEDLRHPGHTPS
ncbi:S-adenosyl methyltransferase [Streptomyces sp. 846.5]|nr:S-adenosyl methyltransferase [Streptomyces sp. 846.5]